MHLSQIIKSQNVATLGGQVKIFQSLFIVSLHSNAVYKKEYVITIDCSWKAELYEIKKNVVKVLGENRTKYKCNAARSLYMQYIYTSNAT